MIISSGASTLAICLALLLSTKAFAQQTPSGDAKPTTTFKTSTRLVVVDVVVTDKRGAPVHDLRESDFQILEGGHEQSLKSFEERKSAGSYIAPPIGGSLAAGVATASNAGQEAAGPALNVILFDALDTASSDQSFARAQVKKVIAELPPGSRIAIFVLRNELHMIQGFTTDTTALAAAMEKDKSSLNGPWFNDPDMVLLGSGTGSSAGLSSTLSGNTVPGNLGPNTYLANVAGRDEQSMTSQLRTEKTFAALSAMARYLAMLPGRKNLLWLAGVFPFDLLPDMSNANPDAFRGTATYNSAMFDLAMQMEAGHIAVYPVDVRGVADEGVYGAAGGGRPSMSTFSAATGAQLGQQSVMENIAHETGGRAIYNDNDIRGEIIETLNQGGNFYTLAYSPEGKDWNGKYRKIEVKTGVKDVHLYYRHGYLAVDPDTAGKVASAESAPTFSIAMMHGAPERAEVVMTIEATGTGKFVEEKDRKPPELQGRDQPFQAHLKGTTQVYAMKCKIDANTVSFTKDANGNYVPRLALTFLAYDADGTVLNSTIGLFNHPLSQAQYNAVLQRGLTVEQTMEIPLGHDYLRIGVHDLQNDKVGATEMPLVVTRNSQSAMSK